tara:strand:+ start:519 stop:677 length:159 start_codon:yes stop_codon:yes gene_type:complete
VSIKHIIKIKKSTPAKEDDLDEDRIRYEEHDEKEYTEQLKKFFKNNDTETDR